MRRSPDLSRATHSELVDELGRRGYLAVPSEVWVEARMRESRLPPQAFLIDTLDHQRARHERELARVRGELDVANGAVKVLIGNGWDRGIYDMTENTNE